MYELTEERIDEQRLIAAVQSDEFGALILFYGTTRDHHDGREVVELAYEAYESMAVPSMARIAEEAIAAYGPCSVAISHRTGIVPVGETSVVIAVGAPHRDKAYLASRYVIDELKARTPIWKKEVYRDGSVWKANPTTTS